MIGIHHLTDYIIVLKVLANQQPMGLSQLVSRTGINCETMKDYLTLLLERNYVEEHFIEDKSVYMITQRGVGVLKYFEEIQRYPSLKIFENYVKIK